MKMKKMMCAAITAGMVLSMAVPAAADEYKFNMGLKGVTVELPSEYYVFTREMSEDDPNLAVFGLDKATIDEILEAQDVYFNALSGDVSEEIVVTGQYTLLFDSYEDLSEDYVEAYREGLEEGMAELGAATTYNGTYENGDYTFEVYEFTINQDGVQVYGKMYCTLKDHYQIGVTLRSTAGSFTSEQDTVLKNLVDSLELGSMNF